ncbi:hypothetical protein [Fodinicola feengrottensis]|uniref:Uncharacterized protein n=1 Tax=Fodinicola feengrottensis TaxID=435914 RepID=A0ABP4SBE5_9ACTN|nr:hypothetical protein [Fodinicola feengrottensis]
MSIAVDDFDLDIRLDEALTVQAYEIPSCSDTNITVGRPCISINASCHPDCNHTTNCG